MTTSAVQARFTQVLDQFGTLAGSTLTAGRLLVSASSAQADLGQLRRLIEAEPGLMVRVLRVANSAFYGQPRKVGSIDRAVTVLGIDGVRVIAAAACLDHALPRAPATRALSAALQRHSLCCAVTARIVARSTAPQQSGEAFVAGLLHDIGCGLLMLVDAEKYLALAQRRAAQAAAQQSLDRAAELLEEQRLFGVTQWEATRTLAERWKLPEWLGASLSHDGHVLAPTGASHALSDAVRWAERIAAELGYPNDFQTGMFTPDDPATALPDSLRRTIMDGAPAQIEELGSALAA